MLKQKTIELEIKFQDKFQELIDKFELKNDCYIKVNIEGLEIRKNNEKNCTKKRNKKS